MKIKILYIEDNPMDLEFVSAALEKFPDFKLEHSELFRPGLECLKNGDFDLILLDLNLPDSPGGLETFSQARSEIPSEIPIVVYTSLDDEQIGLDAVKKGAQGYLVKGHTDGYVLTNTLRHALERGSEENFFRTVVFSGKSPIVVIDWKGTIRFVNPAAEQLFSKPAEEWVGRVFGFPFDPDHPKPIHIEGAGEYHMSVAETEMKNEVLYVLHLHHCETCGEEDDTGAP